MRPDVAAQLIPALPAGTPAYVYVVVAVAVVLVSGLGVLAKMVKPPPTSDETVKNAAKGAEIVKPVPSPGEPVATAAVDSSYGMFRDLLNDLRRDLTQAREEVAAARDEVTAIRAERDTLAQTSYELQVRLRQAEENLARALDEVRVLRGQLEVFYRGPQRQIDYSPPPIYPRDWDQ